jgi:uncharacterized protein YraI
MERVTRHFEEELELLQQRLLSMGGLAEDRMGDSVKAVTNARSGAGRTYPRWG